MDITAVVVFAMICTPLLMYMISLVWDNNEDKNKEKDIERIIRHLKILDKLTRSKE
jgi:hypothetical protein